MAADDVLRHRRDALDDLYAQIAPEPNYRWNDYCRQSMRIAEELDVRHIVTMGAMFADCPHTRALPLDISDQQCQCDMDREYSGPVGIPTVLDCMACEEGFSTTSMWVSVPQYLGSDECTQATMQMLAALSDRIGVELDPGDLAGKAEQWKAQASVLTRCNDDLAQYVKHLEHDYDMQEKADQVARFGAPAAEQLVREAEASCAVAASDAGRIISRQRKWRPFREAANRTPSKRVS